ncbi:methyltransferase [Halapricum sp. CBA1109]|uniref:HemK2/MTQ2 family protein methyltransferase n=1 Tax=Halapricum sp. CBA1109 TaxID=2668068 RepID=UPI0012F8BE9F|nr:HemK2/MTQ2 family protein methyltransferase [Halapricum sp. CBA1109]MUV89253.1 methyltransferase [Halapricum sp. CBA1109]
MSDDPELADKRDLAQVYQPAEDSALLASALPEFVDPGDRALDVGTGSGYIAAEMTEAGADVLASDLNPLACEQARANGLDVVRADLVSPFVDDAFDVVAFNPPYLPTPEAVEFDDWMERALSGGEDGRRVVTPFLERVPRVLAPGGTVLLLVSSLTDIEAVRAIAADNGLDATEVAEEKVPFERLVVLALTHPDDNY